MSAEQTWPQELVDRIACGRLLRRRSDITPLGSPWDEWAELAEYARDIWRHDVPEQLDQIAADPELVAAILARAGWNRLPILARPAPDGGPIETLTLWRQP